MTPISAIPPEVLARLDWLAFDVDDTITDHGRLMSRSLATMERLRDLGVRLAAITGRPLGWAEVWLAQWPIDLAVGENGAGWFVRGREGIEARLYLDDVERIRTERARAFAIAEAVAPSIPIPRDGTARRVDVAFDIAETRKADVAEVDVLDAALREGGFTTVRSSIHLHAACGDWDKQRGLSRALEQEFGFVLTGDGIDRIAFVGDSANDQPLFRAIPISVGVANVADHPLEHRPKFVTIGRASAGFAELGDMIASAKGGS